MRGTLTTLLAGALSLGIFAGQAAAAEWKFNNGLPETRNEAKQLNTFAEDVTELSGR